MASLGEFEFIDQLLKVQAARGQPFYRHPQALGIGDDAALLPPLAANEQVAMASDMLIEGRHYRSRVDPRALGHKVLAVNLSDLAAMGARPLGFTLSAGLRDIRPDWMERFLDGLLSLARDSACPLIGGDTTAVPADAPEVFSVAILGAVPLGEALRRDGLQPEDDLWISGHLGDAAYAVSRNAEDPKLNWPQPRIELGMRLRGIASAAIDISDGLQSEIMHLCNGARNRDAAPETLKAVLNWESLPMGPSVTASIESAALSRADAICIAITGGDEYELLFGAPQRERAAIRSIGAALGLALSRIGHVESGRDGPQIDWVNTAGQPIPAQWQQRISGGGFRHF